MRRANRFIRERIWVLVLLAACAGIFAVVLYLYQMPVEAVGYAALLCAVLEMLLPEGTMKRYAHFACALGLTAAVMRQLLRVIHLIAENLP